MAYLTGQPQGPFSRKSGHGQLEGDSCCSGCASGGSCGGHGATGDFSTNVIGIGLVVGLVFIAVKTMNKAAG
jgi:hypothetical protein